MRRLPRDACLVRSDGRGIGKAAGVVGRSHLLERPRRADELLAEQARIERENADALRVLARYLKSPIHFENANVEESDRFRDAGVVRMLTAEAASLRERKPKFALLLATAACAVARKLSPSRRRRNSFFSLPRCVSAQTRCASPVGSKKRSHRSTNQKRFFVHCRRLRSILRSSMPSARPSFLNMRNGSARLSTWLARQLEHSVSLGSDSAH